MFERNSHFEQAQTEASVVSRFHIGIYQKGIVNLHTVLTYYFSFIELRFDTRANKQTTQGANVQSKTLRSEPL
jgi:hypothetical protein